MFLSSWTSIFFRYSFNEAYHSSDCWVHSKEKFFLFSHGSLRGIILEFGFLSYLKLCSLLFNEQTQLLMRLHPLRNTRKYIMCPLPLTTTWLLIMRLHLVMNEWQLTYFRSLKNYHVLIFFFFLAVSSSVPNMVEGSASPLTYIWLIESEVLPCLSHLVIIERGEGETASLSIILLTTIVRWFLLATIVGHRPPSPTTRQKY